jgi:hypothetical protein
MGWRGVCLSECLSFRMLLELRMEFDEILNVMPLEATPNYYFPRVY